ncbi:hypothetical protein J5N97_028276 [Dioscorea zingiberensis]|uniref:Uncharacterized protein n=1 Tax=Dioscorea zingiberensis TaxID=325984 RepID=A0A9D5H4P0_9LILI|nr:hypothetical protein J5N97_028276 [Dioscorea zingiberensis]
MATSATTAPPSSSSPSSPPSSTLSEPGQAQSSRGRGHQRYQGLSSSLARSRTPSSITSAMSAGSTTSTPTPSASSPPPPVEPAHSPSPSPSSVPCSVLATSPHTKAWSAVIARLASSPDDDPTTAFHLFNSILRRLPSPLSSDAHPDTAALKACANLDVYLVYLRWHFSRRRKRNLAAGRSYLGPPSAARASPFPASSAASPARFIAGGAPCSGPTTSFSHCVRPPPLPFIPPGHAAHSCKLTQLTLPQGRPSVRVPPQPSSGRPAPSVVL